MIIDNTASESGGTGIIDVDMGAPAAGETWFIERMNGNCNSAVATALTIYLNAVSPNNVLDYTDLGNNAVADNASPIEVPAGNKVIWRWTGAAALSIAYARMQVRVISDEF